MPALAGPGPAGPARGRAPWGAGRLPRSLHPGAWWVWALGLATAAARTGNPMLLLLLLAAAGWVVVARRSDAPWARSYVVFLRLAVVVLLVRLLLAVIFAAPVGDHVLVRLPQLPLPHALSGLRIGGPITAEGLLAATYDGLRLGVLLACAGAANSLASPTRLLRALPAGLYEAGVAVTVAMTFAPQAIVAVGQVRAAHRLRGRPDRGLRSLRGLATPVLEGALERAVALAAAMDSRGFGRRGPMGRARHRTLAALTVAGLMAVCASLYGLLDARAPGAFGVPLLLLGALASAVGLAAGSRRSPRTRYRPDPWRWPEWAVSGAGAVVAALFVVAGWRDPAGMTPATSPPSLPTLPLLALVGLGVALLPAWLAPPLPRSRPAGDAA